MALKQVPDALYHRAADDFEQTLVREPSNTPATGILEMSGNVADKNTALVPEELTWTISVGAHN